MERGKVMVEGRNLSKEFNGNVVLKDVSIQCVQGEGLALAGENGAGKSTLMNIISGGLSPSAGTILADGKECHFSCSKDGRKAGIAFVHQELSLMREMTAGENIMLGMEPRRGGWIDQKKLHEQASAVLEEIGYDIDAYELVRNLSPAQRQIVEIAKAWAASPRVLIFDEPTSSLNKAESDILFRFIGAIKKKGVSVIVISHRMDDIFATCDRVMVLKDGMFVFESPVKDTDSDEIISKMVGREFKNVYPPRNEVLSSDIKLELKNVSIGDLVKSVSLQVPRGAVIGIGGLEGQGQRHLSRGLFGIEPFTSGEYVINGQAKKIASPGDAVRNKIAFVSDDRKAEGLFLDLSCGENILSLSYRRNSRWGFVKKKQADREILEGIRQMNIKLDDQRQAVKSLSGGNQQKIVFSKWIKTNPQILILHEPTRGIDVQSKLEIYELIRRLTGEGVSVLVFTSDMLELIGISDEIYVMYEGRISGRVAGKDATEEAIMQLSANTGKEERP
ncbi:MAG: sugar ABC transporter ATP-binding protein [Hungatella sp.]|nr:sugar ABC transporter ATP-binding protein [Hungatella sp.]